MKPAPITDPRVIPVVGQDDHLPPLAPGQMTVERIRRQLAFAAQWTPVFTGDGAVMEADQAPRAAAVLVPLVQSRDELRVLLTQRTPHLRAHAGQVSFPGGRCEPDDPDAAAAALREAQEEVGVLPTEVTVLGTMPPYLTVTGYRVTPVVGLLQAPVAVRPDPGEVADVFEVPLAFLMNPAHHRRHRVLAGDMERHFLSMPWQGTGWSGRTGEYFIWGATAAMLRNLYHLLARPQALDK